MNRYLQQALDELPGYRQALGVAEEAQKVLNGLAAPENPAAQLDPMSTGTVTPEWLTATMNHDAALGLLDRQRAVLLDLKQRAEGTARGICAQNVNQLLARLNANLSDLLDDATDVVGGQLGDATSPEEAILVDAGAGWKRLTQLADDYAQLRDAQRQVMAHAPADYTISARRADGTGEDHASDLFLKNIDDLWPDWRTGGGGIHTIHIDGHLDRIEPWPADQTQLLLWLVVSDAEPWVPTLAELDQLRADRIARNNPMPAVVAGVRKPINRTPARVV